MKLERYAGYLRKSRTDLQAEMLGEGETLRRHENMLNDLARSMGIVIDKFYREVVSGETITARPKMIELLEDVRQGIYDGIFVVEVERLARGNSIDQGIVMQSFQFSDTKIITPKKIYDPNNESDETFFEMSLFLSRCEYKTIKRRINDGRIASVKEGKFAGNIPPYGYTREKLKGKGYKLIIDEKEAEAVRMVFKMYGDEGDSTNQIANRLNILGYKTRKNGEWTISTLKRMLTNNTYIGQLHWGNRKQVKKLRDGEIVISRPYNKDDVIITDGLHEPIIDLELWEKVQTKFKLRAPRVQYSKEVLNPFAGLITCGMCGKLMQRRPYRDERVDYIICTNPKCQNVSAPVFLVEEQLLASLEAYYKSYTVDTQTALMNEEDNLVTLQKELSKLKDSLDGNKKKHTKVCEFYEDGTYTKEIFKERSTKIRVDIIQLEDQIKSKENEIIKATHMKNQRKNYLPKIMNFIDIYKNEETTPKQKNDLMKVILEKIVYTKTEKAKRGGDRSNFQLDLYPRILKNQEISHE